MATSNSDTSRTSPIPGVSTKVNNVKPISINDLNDDCLRHIFKSPALAAWDLAMIAKVCKRFRKIAHTTFQSKYNNGKTIKFGKKCWRYSQLEEIFSQFGELITSMDSANNGYFYQTNSVFYMMLKYCPNVKELICNIDDVDDDDFDDGYFTQVSTFIKKLKVFDVISEKDHFMLVKLFHSELQYEIEKLTIHVIHLVMPQIPFPQLREIFIDARDTRQPATIRQFFALNRQLEKITFYYCSFGFGIEQILQYTPNVKELTLDNYKGSGDFSYFSQLEHLETLKIQFARSSGVPIMLRALYNGGVQLKCLLLDSINDTDDLINAICQLKSINHLRLDKLDESHLMRLIHEMENLKRIEIITGCMSLAGVRDALKDAAEVNRVSIQIEIPTSGSLVLSSAKVFDEIDTIQRQRNIKLDVEVNVIDRKLDEITVPEVNWKSWDVNIYGKTFE